MGKKDVMAEGFRMLCSVTVRGFDPVVVVIFLLHSGVFPRPMAVLFSVKDVRTP